MCKQDTHTACNCTQRRQADDCNSQLCTKETQAIAQSIALPHWRRLVEVLHEFRTPAKTHRYRCARKTQDSQVKGVSTSKFALLHAASTVLQHLTGTRRHGVYHYYNYCFTHWSTHTRYSLYFYHYSSISDYLVHHSLKHACTVLLAGVAGQLLHHVTPFL